MPNEPMFTGFDASLIELRDFTEYAEDPLIDDPTTGAGNEDLWIGDVGCEEAGSDVVCRTGPGGPDD